MAPVSLQFIVVGGGVAGLATAYALRRGGHDVLVLESSDGKAKSRGGLQSPPNMTRVLYHWGLQEQLARVSQKCGRFSFFNGTTGTKMGSMIMDEDFMTDLMGDFLFIQHQDLLDTLRSLVVKAGVTIAYNTKVVDVVRSSSDCATVRVESGETILADVVVLADGVDSSLRPLITGIPNEETVDLDSKHLNLTFLIPVEEVAKHEELKFLLEGSDWTVHMGSGYVLAVNITHDRTHISGTMAYTYHRDVTPADLEWAEHPLEYYQFDMSIFTTKARKLLELPKTVWGRVYHNTEMPEDYVCDEGKMVLVGDAAHPLLPTGNHRTALILEDAETLGCIFARIQHRDQISSFLTAYEEIRHPRSSTAYMHDQGIHMLMRVAGPGPEQDARDELLRSTMVHGDWDHMDEGVFREVWGGELDMFSHDATEKVDDWWSQWGAMVSVQRRQSVILQQQEVHQDEKQLYPTSTQGSLVDDLVPRFGRTSISVGYAV